jgi:hypothetical protein
MYLRHYSSSIIEPESGFCVYSFPMLSGILKSDTVVLNLHVVSVSLHCENLSRPFFRASYAIAYLICRFVNSSQTRLQLTTVANP